MHLCEGRPLVIMISGVVEFDKHGLDEDKKLKYGKDIFEHVINNLRKAHELKFEDRTGYLFEIIVSDITNLTNQKLTNPPLCETQALAKPVKALSDYFFQLIDSSNQQRR